LDLKVYELRRTRASLEDVFLELTTQNPTQKTEAVLDTNSEILMNTETEENMTVEPENAESETVENSDSQPENQKLDVEN